MKKVKNAFLMVLLSIVCHGLFAFFMTLISRSFGDSQKTFLEEFIKSFTIIYGLFGGPFIVLAIFTLLNLKLVEGSETGFACGIYYGTIFVGSLCKSINPYILGFVIVALICSKINTSLKSNK